MSKKILAFHPPHHPLKWVQWVKSSHSAKLYSKKIEHLSTFLKQLQSNVVSLSKLKLVSESPEIPLSLDQQTTNAECKALLECGHLLGISASESGKFADFLMALQDCVQNQLAVLHLLFIQNSAGRSDFAKQSMFLPHLRILLNNFDLECGLVIGNMGKKFEAWLEATQLALPREPEPKAKPKPFSLTEPDAFTRFQHYVNRTAAAIHQIREKAVGLAFNQLVVAIVSGEKPKLEGLDFVPDETDFTDPGLRERLKVVALALDCPRDVSCLDQFSYLFAKTNRTRFEHRFWEDLLADGPFATELDALVTQIKHPEVRQAFHGEIQRIRTNQTRDLEIHQVRWHIAERRMGEIIRDSLVKLNRVPEGEIKDLVHRELEVLVSICSVGTDIQLLGFRAVFFHKLGIVTRHISTEHWAEAAFGNIQRALGAANLPQILINDVHHINLALIHILTRRGRTDKLHLLVDGYVAANKEQIDREANLITRLSEEPYLVLSHLFSRNFSLTHSVVDLPSFSDHLTWFGPIFSQHADAQITVVQREDAIVGLIRVCQSGELREVIATVSGAVHVEPKRLAVWAAKAGNLDLFRIAFPPPQEIDWLFRDDFGYTLIENAVLGGNPEIVRLFIGQILPEFDPAHPSIIGLAVESKNTQMIDFLIENQTHFLLDIEFCFAKLDHRGYSLLAQAVAGRKVAMFNHVWGLLSSEQRERQLRHFNINGQTILHLAVCEPAMFIAVLDKIDPGSDILNLTHPESEPLLHTVCIEGDPRLLAALIEKKPDHTIVNSSGNFAAACCVQPDCIVILSREYLKFRINRVLLSENEELSVGQFLRDLWDHSRTVHLDQIFQEFSVDELIRLFNSSDLDNNLLGILAAHQPAQLCNWIRINPTAIRLLTVEVHHVTYNGVIYDGVRPIDFIATLSPLDLLNLLVTVPESGWLLLLTLPEGWGGTIAQAIAERHAVEWITKIEEDESLLCIIFIELPPTPYQNATPLHAFLAEADPAGFLRLLNRFPATYPLLGRQSANRILNALLLYSRAQTAQFFIDHPDCIQYLVQLVGANYTVVPRLFTHIPTQDEGESSTIAFDQLINIIDLRPEFITLAFQAPDLLKSQTHCEQFFEILYENPGRFVPEYLDLIVDRARPGTLFQFLPRFFSDSDTAQALPDETVFRILQIRRCSVNALIDLIDQRTDLLEKIKPLNVEHTKTPVLCFLANFEMHRFVDFLEHHPKRALEILDLRIENLGITIAQLLISRRQNRPRFIQFLKNVHLEDSVYAMPVHYQTSWQVWTKVGTIGEFVAGDRILSYEDIDFGEFKEIFPTLPLLEQVHVLYQPSIWGKTSLMKNAAHPERSTEFRMLLDLVPPGSEYINWQPFGISDYPILYTALEMPNHEDFQALLDKNPNLLLLNRTGEPFSLRALYLTKPVPPENLAMMGNCLIKLALQLKPTDKKLKIVAAKLEEIIQFSNTSRFEEKPDEIRQFLVSIFDGVTAESVTKFFQIRSLNRNLLHFSEGFNAPQILSLVDSVPAIRALFSVPILIEGDRCTSIAHQMVRNKLVLKKIMPVLAEMQTIRDFLMLPTYSSEVPQLTVGGEPKPNTTIFSILTSTDNAMVQLINSRPEIDFMFVFAAHNRYLFTYVQKHEHAAQVSFWLDNPETQALVIGSPPLLANLSVALGRYEPSKQKLMAIIEQQPDAPGIIRDVLILDYDVIEPIIDELCNGMIFSYLAAHPDQIELIIGPTTLNGLVPTPAIVLSRTNTFHEILNLCPALIRLLFLKLADDDDTTFAQFEIIDTHRHRQYFAFKVKHPELIAEFGQIEALPLVQNTVPRGHPLRSVRLTLGDHLSYLFDQTVPT